MEVLEQFVPSDVRRQLWHQDQLRRAQLEWRNLEQAPEQYYPFQLLGLEAEKKALAELPEAGGA
ncbi:MAG: hypothetical protein OHK0053_27630 [Microscillaceae bacterium]